MQKLFLIPLLLFIYISSFCQFVTIEYNSLPLIVTGTPYAPPYEYSYGQTIYLENDIQGSGIINALTFYYNGTSLNYSDSITVYIGTTYFDNLDSILAVKSSTLTQVFRGTLTNYTIPGSVTIPLQTFYPYSGDSNLVIAINETKAGLDTPWANQFIGYYPQPSNRGLSWANTTPWDLYYFDLYIGPGAYPTSGGGVPKVTLHGLSRLPCQSPKRVKFSNITHDSTRMTWSPPDSGNTPTSYDVYYATSRYKPSSAISTPYTSVDTSYLLTSLNSATRYYAWVRTRSNSCYSVWTLVDSFKTLCAPSATPTPPEPFNKPFPPNCWQKGIGLLSNPTSFSYISEYSQYWKGRPYKNNPGSDSAANTAFSIDSLHHWLISPPYNLVTASNKSLEFDAALTTNSIINPLQAYFAADDKLVVVISTDEGLTWSSANALRTFTAPQVIPYTGAHYAIPISSYIGIVRIGFYAESTVGNLTGGNIPNLFIDNVKISEALPVKLLEFTGIKEGSNNLLQWRTATEQNNRGFELQRAAPSNSPQGGGQEPSAFSTIAFVPSKANNGNSTAELSYNYKDKKPLSGGNYYRLKQVDFDGKFTYSNVVFIKGEAVTELVLSALFPNPTRQLLNVVFQSPKAQQVQIIIADIAGKTVQQQTLQLQKGENNKTVNVAALSKGTYIVKVICADGCEAAVSKFVKE